MSEVTELGRWQVACLEKEAAKNEAESRMRIAEYKLSKAIDLIQRMRDKLDLGPTPVEAGEPGYILVNEATEMLTELGL